MRTAVAFEQLSSSVHLGPARVLETRDNRVLLATEEAKAWALVALAYPYQMAVNDIVLAIGQDNAWYVIGVLRGTGRTTMTVPADLEISAPRGCIELKAAQGIHLYSPGVKIVAGLLELVSHRVFERFGNATRWVKDAFQLRAGRVRTVVEADYRVKAGRILQHAQDAVKIDGRKIDLG
jgi:hypothetical protein